jgi:hypothetical protein
MLKMIVECDWLECPRTQEIEYESQVPENWGSDYPDYWCPRHYNRYTAWTPRTRSELEKTITAIYGPYIEQVVNQMPRFDKFLKGRPGDVVTFSRSNPNVEGKT